MKGRFITLEGVEGVGKSTNLEFIRQYIESLGVPYLVTREPGGTPLAEQIRELILTPREEPVAELCELLLVFAARAQHLKNHILPALNQGVWVISDRFTDATYAYQGRGRGINVEDILKLEAMVHQGIQPDMTIYLDCPPEIGMARAVGRAELDRIESAGVGFMAKVRQGYLERIAQFPDRFCTIDASRELAQVQIEISKTLDEALPKWL